MMQATSSSKGEAKPASASSNIAAFGQGRTASRMRSMARSMSKGFFGFSDIYPATSLYPTPVTVSMLNWLPERIFRRCAMCTSTVRV